MIRPAALATNRGVSKHNWAHVDGRHDVERMLPIQSRRKCLCQLGHKFVHRLVLRKFIEQSINRVSMQRHAPGSVQMALAQTIGQSVAADTRADTARDLATPPQGGVHTMIPVDWRVIQERAVSVS